MHALALLPLMLALGLQPATAQAVNDPAADTAVLHPAFAQDHGPVVAVDSGHNNYHTIAGRYEPFAQLLRHDGFRVADSSTPLTADSLSSFRILVISNARPPQPVKDAMASAFSETEITTLQDWVARGGSLLLIADHQPFATSARQLALAFGFQLEDGVVERDPQDGRPDIFAVSDGSLRKDVVTRGRGPDETITSIRTFTGSAFRAPPSARSVIVLPSGFMIHQCGLPCPDGVPEHDATGYLQGAVMPFGKGRVAVFGEAAMFSAQVIASFKPPFYFGFNAKGAEQNRQFVLNVMHWLAGILPDK